MLVAIALQGFGIEFGQEDQQAALGAVETVLTGIGSIMIIGSKLREKKRKEKTDQSGKASVGAMAFIAILGALTLLAAACATGPSQYAADNPDSYLVKAISAAGMTPEGVQQQISAIVQAEIAMGTFSREDALNYMAGLEVYLADGANYNQANALLDRYMTQYVAKSDPISHAAVLAYYLFKPKLNIPDLGMPIVEADRKVIQDLFAAVRSDLGE